MNLIRDLVLDFRFGARILRNRPTYSIPAVATLALAIAATTTIFSIVDGSVLRPLPYPEPDRLVALEMSDPLHGRHMTGAMRRDFLDWRERQQVFDALALVMNRRLTLLGSGDPEQIDAPLVTSDFFDVFRVRPSLGRVFTREDELPHRDRVAVIADAFWRERFGADPAIVGRIIHFDHEAYEIVGVLPPEFVYSRSYGRSDTPARVFVPLSFDASDRQHGVVQSFGGLCWARLRAGISAAQASSAMSQLQSSLDAGHVSSDRGFTTVTARPALDVVVGDARNWLLMLLGAVACVLLIACANVANLVLTTGMARERELTMRLALGASRLRLARQVLAETLLLAAGGAVAGVTAASIAVPWIVSALPRTVPRGGTIHVDARALACAAALTALTALLCAIAPSFRAARSNGAERLRASGSGVVGAPQGRFLRTAFAWAELTLAIVLTIGAGLFVTSFTRLMRIDPGFDARDIVTVDISPPGGSNAAVPAAAYLESLRDAAVAVPGVTGAAVAVFGAPFNSGWGTFPLKIVEQPATSNAAQEIGYHPISAELLPLLRVPLRRGRHLAPTDRARTVPVAVINDAASRRFWSGTDPLGQHVIIRRVAYQIVGIVGDMRYVSPARPTVPELYMPLEQAPVSGGTLLIRLPHASSASIAAVKQALWRAAPEQPLGDVLSVDETLHRARAARQFNMILMALFGACALLISAIGVYGVIAFTVAQRTREIGVRLALGARTDQVVGLFVRQGAGVLLAGILSGAGLAWWLSVVLESYLFQVHARDPLVYAASASVLASVAAIACWLPARRAARVDPLVALRAE